MAVINGEEKLIEEQNLLDFLKNEGYDTERIVVEINLDIVPKDKWEDYTIKNQDKIEILRFVGGG